MLSNVNNISKQQLEEAWDYWYPLVYGYFYRRINNQSDVEDLTSVTITALLTAKEVKSPNGFVWQVARNQLASYIKTKSTTPNYVQLDEFSENQFAQHSYGYSEISTTDEVVSPWYLEKKSRLQECIKNNLNPDEQKIVELSLIEELNSNKIGEMLNLKPATVRQKLKRSIDKLRTKCKQVWDKAGLGLLFFFPGIKFSSDVKVVAESPVNPFIPNQKEEEPWQILFETNKSYRSSYALGLSALLAKFGLNAGIIASLGSKMASSGKEKLLILTLVSALFSGGTILGLSSNSTKSNLVAAAKEIFSTDQPAKNSKELLANNFFLELTFNKLNLNSAQGNDNLNSVAYVYNSSTQQDSNSETSDILNEDTSNSNQPGELGSDLPSTGDPSQLETEDPTTGQLENPPSSSSEEIPNPNGSTIPEPTQPIPAEPVPTEPTVPEPEVVEPSPVQPEPFPEQIPPVEEPVVPAPIEEIPTVPETPTIPNVAEYCYLQLCAVKAKQTLPDGSLISRKLLVRNCTEATSFFTETEYNLISSNQFACVGHGSSIRNATGTISGNIRYDFFIEESLPSGSLVNGQVHPTHPAGHQYGVQTKRIYVLVTNNTSNNYTYYGSDPFYRILYFGPPTCDPLNPTDFSNPLCISNNDGDTMQNNLKSLYNYEYYQMHQAFDANGNGDISGIDSNVLNFQPLFTGNLEDLEIIS